MKKSLLVCLGLVALGLLMAADCGGCGSANTSPGTNGNTPGASSPTKDKSPMHDNDAPK